MDEIFYRLICQSKTAKSLGADSQSYLFCSADSDALMMLAEYLISLSESRAANTNTNYAANAQNISNTNNTDLDTNFDVNFGFDTNTAAIVNNNLNTNDSNFDTNYGATPPVNSTSNHNAGYENALKNPQGAPKNFLNCPDVIILPAAEKVLVSDIETITNTAAVTALGLSHKYYILKNAHTMNDAAANKLLKTLEEPPKNVKIIVMAESEYDVLPTVRSRCRIVTLPPFPETELDRAAEKAYGDSPFLDKAKSLSFGSITRLKKAASGGFEDAEELVFDTLLNMKNSTMVVKYSQAINKKKGELSAITEMFQLVLSDALRCSCDMPPVLSYRAGDIRKVAEFYHADTILRLSPVFERAHKRLKFSGNAASITDELLFSLLEVRQKCQS